MTELNQKNREIYLDFVKSVWNFDDESMEYVKHRTSDEWEPVPELKALIDGSTSYEDQRIRYTMDMANPKIQSFFEKDDEAYKMFKSTFKRALAELENNYSCPISYQDFINNKVVFKKNVTKLKKVFEVVYEANKPLFNAECSGYSNPAEFIVKAFERIGAYKKSAKKLELVISFNPIDWFLSSTSENFTSCFNINNPQGGCQYCLGLPFLCGDKNRVMLYITDGTKKHYEGIEVDSVQTRTWGILDKSNNIAIVKWYPNNTVGTSPVNLITGRTCFISSEHFVEGKYTLDVLSTKLGAVIGVYSDMGSWEMKDGKLYHKGNGKTGQQCFTKNGSKLSASGSTYHLDYGILNSRLGLDIRGWQISTWKKNSANIDMMFIRGSCSCGKEDGGFFVNREDGTKKFFCRTCYAENIVSCFCCENSFVRNENTKEITDSDGIKRYVCGTCESRDRLRIYLCDCCGKYSKTINTADDGTSICDSCFESGVTEYNKCPNCESFTKTSRIIYNSFNNTTSGECNNCHSENNGINYITFGRTYQIVTRRNTGVVIE